MTIAFNVDTEFDSIGYSIAQHSKQATERQSREKRGQKRPDVILQMRRSVRARILSKQQQLSIEKDQYYF